MKVAIVDYDVGNVQSVINCLHNFDNISPILTSDSETILGADAIILPGVGAFKKAMSKLKEKQLVGVLQSVVVSNKPLLGICLGMQLLFEESEEFGHCLGLGLIQGSVKKLPTDGKVKLPFIGWSKLNQNKIRWKNTLCENVSDNNSFYFVHSYRCIPRNDSDILSTTSHGNVEFCSSVNNKNIMGCQFHPEKSAHSGIKLLSNFLNLAKKK